MAIGGYFPLFPLILTPKAILRGYRAVSIYDSTTIFKCFLPLKLGKRKGGARRVGRLPIGNSDFIERVSLAEESVSRYPLFFAFSGCYIGVYSAPPQGWVHAFFLFPHKPTLRKRGEHECPNPGKKRRRPKPGPRQKP